MQDARLVLRRPIRAEHSRWIRVWHTEHIQAVQRIPVHHISVAKGCVVWQVYARALCQAQIDVRLFDFWLHHVSLSMLLVFHSSRCGGTYTVRKRNLTKIDPIYAKPNSRHSLDTAQRLLNVLNIGRQQIGIRQK
jgi:hypothetical protein